MDVAALGLRVDSRDVQRGSIALDRLSQSSKKAETAARGVSGASRRAATEIVRGNERARTSVTGLTAAFAGLRSQLLLVGGATAAALGGAGLIRAADSFTTLGNSLRVAGVEAQEFERVQGRLFAAANQNGVAIEALGSLYSRATLSSDELGASQADLLRFTDGVTAALRVQGGPASAASGALLQLSQSLGAGTVRAEEFNSILEGALPIAQAAARGLDAAGGSVAKLRTMVVAGEVSSQAFFEALLEGFEETERQAQSATLTIGQSLTSLNNSFVRLVGSLDSGLGASSGLASAIQTLASGLDFVGRNAETVGDIAQVVGATLLTAFGPLILGAVRSMTIAVGTGLVSAFTALGAVIAANPIGALATAIVAVTTAVFTFRDELSRIFGVDITGAAEGAANFIIGSFVGAFNSILAVWDKLPAAIGDLVLQAAQSVADGVVTMIREALVLINSMIAKINGELSGIGVAIPFAPNPTSVGRANIENPFAGSASDVSGAISAEMTRALGQNYFGQDTSQGVAATTNATATAAQKLSSANDNAAESASRLAKSLEDAARAGRSTKEQWRDIAGGIAGDLRTALADGENFFRSLQGTASKALDTIADKLLNEVLDAMFQVNKGAGSLFGNGGVGGIFGAIGSIFGGLFADGAAFNRGSVVPFASGGIVGGPTSFAMSGGRTGLMGEAGPEAIMPLRRGPDGKLGVAGGGGRAEVIIRLDPSLRAEMQGDMEGVAVRVVRGGLSEYDRKVAPRTVSRVRDDPRRRG